MVWMESFCFYCSVRLGVIVSAIIAMVELLIPLVFFFVFGSDILISVVETIEKDDEYSEQVVIKRLLKMLSEQPQDFVAVIEAFIIIHIISCTFAIYGALKLSKWFMVPYCSIEFIRFLILLTTHIIAMIVLKKVLNLGILIAATIAGGFVILFVGYRWAAVIAMFQIIKLVHSEKYKALYGDDPLQEWQSDEPNQFGANIAMFAATPYDSSEGVKAWDAHAVPKKRFTGVATIPIDEPDITLAVKEFQNWHLNEMIRPRHSNLIKFY